MLIFQEATTGAADDLQRATEMARAMVTRYGMEPEVGQASLFRNGPHYLDLPGLGPQHTEASDDTSAKIDAAISNLVKRAFDRATAILQTCALLHKDSAQRLLDKETFSEADLVPIQVAVKERIGDPSNATGQA